ncbi:DNA-binding transcriptional LysR family regulator [Cupriavidus gilardii J11]|uniref:DNA-binding transcriptional LysR family regulator n=1 Tax=Cupriavidus gilardii J11 TaxID=936133 RepID=A0A562BUZ0_9BURK|nr:LysR family transcriptional regulator [Cupriavidus gilardii]TWG88620.1 DNA-binding transcriptional LysR family regulator [Cupriavidus gilardii J11]
MNLTLREFRVFRVVYERRSFSGASEAVHMTQSAVSKVCQEMEAKVGQRLFERSTRKVIPTQLAHQLYGYVCEVLGTMDAAERSLRSLLDMEAGEVSVAASPMMSLGLLGRPVTEFHGAHPGIRIAMHELSTDETIDHVVNGKADFGLVSIESGHAKLAIEHLYDETMFVVCAPDHELARQRQVSWQRLATVPQISLHGSFSTRRTIDRIFAAMQLTYVSSIEVGTVLSAIGFAKARLGVAVLPGYVRQFVADLGLVARPLPEAPVKHRISLITRWNARLSTPAERLAGAVRQALSKAAP